ncbi:hypothetical protein DICPUDRAFT_94995 [Dictyostelium purpureum]|uniref:Lysosomal dipeptide transporter MFSD1 n=1 Tax=Dictyostelium purpureum TaxID=5786 RepID=F0ZQY0_DICPU|nr:uncharacterized protein DICPUDRAFT_94995 [Dictyostelium purpureum]EGC33659.1 hypothetical protein DICPUDRAFT_94995 [Dictyostelium purpureum]|eukprot:XP_003289829.1 hypothetical protein DICPUDRAFT_94995 [Dictyostelium purpureum]
MNVTNNSNTNNNIDNNNNNEISQVVKLVNSNYNIKENSNESLISNDEVNSNYNNEREEEEDISLVINNYNSQNSNIEITTDGNDSNEDNEKENFKDFIYEKTPTAKEPHKKFSIFSFFNLIRNNKKRIATVFLIINLGFPVFLSYNNPSSMVQIFKREYSIDATQFGRLYSIYALPNVIMVFLGGILVDLIGTNKSSLIFSTILTISTILAAISSSTHSYGLLMFSRVLLGLGGESLLVCIATFITDMFEANQVSLVMGIEATWVQFGSLVAFGVLPSFYNASSFPMTMWFIAIIASIGSILNIVFIIYQPKLRFNKEQPIPLENIADDEETPYGENSVAIDTESQLSSENKSFLVLFKENIIQAFHIVKSMSMRTWVLTIVAFFGYSAFFGLDIIFTDMAIERYNYSDAFAAGIMASETFTTGIVSPLFGIFVKKLKRNILAMGIGITMTMVGIFLIVVTDVMPMAFVILSGCGYTLMSNAIYSSIPLIVEEDGMGTAYGCIGTSYNIGIVLFPLFLTYFRSKTGDYIISMWILILSSAIAIVCLFILKYFDKKEPNHLKRLDHNDYNFLKYFKLK